MTTRKIKIFLTASTVTTAAFFAGKYYERQMLYENRLAIPIQAKPALPIYGSVSTESDSIGFHNVSHNRFNKFKSFAKKFLPNKTPKVDAASPVPTPNSEEMEEILAEGRRMSEIMRLGFPGVDNLMTYKDYVLSYDKRNRVAHWVFEHLTEEKVKRNDKVDRSKCDFKEEANLHPYFRSNNKDYKGSGYDRGHLAAAGNHKASQDLVEETFYLTNIAPQVGKGFNRDSWNRLEKYVRQLTKIYPNVYCCTGPLYLPRRRPNGKMYVEYEVIGSNHVAVPTHFFKVVVGESKDGKLDMECYVMENTQLDDKVSLKSYQVPPPIVERAAGLLFVDNISKDKLRTINGQKPS